jgi:hypothetical protein
MARIQNIDPSVTSLGHDGKEYASEGDGVFDVPSELAEQLVSFPHWRMHDGEAWPHPLAPEEAEAERVAELIEQAVEVATAQYKQVIRRLETRLANLEEPRRFEPTAAGATSTTLSLPAASKPKRKRAAPRKARALKSGE